MLLQYELSAPDTVHFQGELEANVPLITGLNDGSLMCHP